MPSESTVLVSGGFDPLHTGHLDYLEIARKRGRVVVALNSDAWLKRKKGFLYQNWEARRRILLATRFVDEVVAVEDSDGTVCEAIRRIRPEFFAKGGDRTPENTPEVETCQEYGIPILWGCGEKKDSSSEIEKRRWGKYEVLYDGDFKVKILTLRPYSKTSIQRHEKRNEHWIYPDNSHKYIPRGTWHQLENDTGHELRVIEVQTGTYFGEDDIERA